MLFSFIQSLSDQFFRFQPNIGCMYNHVLAWIMKIGIVVRYPVNLFPAFTRHSLVNIQHLYRRFLPFFFTHLITSPPTNGELSDRIGSISSIYRENGTRSGYALVVVYSDQTPAQGGGGEVSP